MINVDYNRELLFYVFRMVLGLMFFESFFSIFFIYMVFLGIVKFLKGFNFLVKIDC